MVSSHDEELLQLYVDRELALEASRALEARVARESALASRLEAIVAAREARARAF
jgi:anti-sigma factor RsiW